uniref:Uncharacterized protein n=1 Tax=Heterorhabditis bacteriophora TaxID=37862 RepID=A0A1I7XAM3_HETBA
MRRSSSADVCRTVESWNVPLWVMRKGNKNLVYNDTFANPLEPVYKVNFNLRKMDVMFLFPEFQSYEYYSIFSVLLIIIIIIIIRSNLIPKRCVTNIRNYFINHSSGQNFTAIVCNSQIENKYKSNSNEIQFINSNKNNESMGQIMAMNEQISNEFIENILDEGAMRIPRR